MRGEISTFIAMALSIRSLLPLLLVILQFFAPLLHAHAGQRDAHFGLHIPGLEAYSHAAGGSSIASQPDASYAATEGCLVAIDDGMREKPIRSVENPAGSDLLPLLAWTFSAAAAPALAKFPQPPQILPRPRAPSLAPRAPPVI